MVSNASDDFPEPEIPVNTMSLSRGSSRSTLRRLCSRAPRIVIVSATVRPWYRLRRRIERMFVPAEPAGTPSDQRRLHPFGGLGHVAESRSRPPQRVGAHACAGE